VPVRVLTAMVLTWATLAGEALLSLRHERALRARGAVEPPGDVHFPMALAYPAAFLAMGLEGAWRLRPPDRWFAAGVLLWLASKGLKYAAIRALGARWCFRVLVPPGAPLVGRGPYRALRHPNYVAVIGELVAVALMCAAPIAGVVSAAGFGLLIRRRIRVEERALGLRV
jgi:methyltransferase